VCLRCRHDARIAARDRMKRLTLRGVALIIVAATIITAVVLGRTAMRGRTSNQAPAATAPSPTSVATVTDSIADSTRAAEGGADSMAVVAQGSPQVVSTSAPTTAPQIVLASASRTADAPIVPVPVAAPAAPARPRAPVSPVVPVGQSSLKDGLTANRGENGVTVLFDTPNVRTRLPEKFERVVRATLPEIYGPVADSALARIPTGGLARQGDLLSVLPARGVRIPLAAPWEIRVYPETRPGQDGPLVIRYRAVVSSGE